MVMFAIYMYIIYTSAHIQHVRISSVLIPRSVLGRQGGGPLCVRGYDISRALGHVGGSVSSPVTYARRPSFGHSMHSLLLLLAA